MAKEPVAKYRGSRIAASDQVWIRKFVTEARGKTHGAMDISRSMQAMIGDLSRKAAVISAGKEVPLDEAMDMGL